MRKHFISFLLLCSILSNTLSFMSIRSHAIKPTETSDLSITAASAVLMDSSGHVLYEKSPDTELVPASITKIMTLILIFEALDVKQFSLNDSVTVSEYAAKMGGSQVFLEPNETQTVNDMIKCISIASANDAAVAMAEKVAGSESAFVNRMNEKAKSLGMKHTQFKNCTGLDDDIKSGHVTSARDVALMSRELITKHPQISKYSTVWMDTIKHVTKKGTSEFGLTNTNKLIRFYPGITGLKTGSTSKAKYCLSATAQRNGVNLISVIMAAPDHKARFQEASHLLDYGFAKCRPYKDNSHFALEPIKIKGGSPQMTQPVTHSTFSYTFMEDYKEQDVKRSISIQSDIAAPIKKGTQIGKILYTYQNNPLGTLPLYASESIKKSNYSDCLAQTLFSFFLNNK